MSIIANRVKVAVDGTPGTGTIDLGAAVTGFQSFADGGVTNGQVVSYAIEDGMAWEVGTGTYTTGTPNTLSRTVIESSNSDAALDLSSNAVVFITALSGDLQNAVDMDQGVATTDSPSFADLTLSGGVVFGSTGGAVTSKTLDDYEEGTWTPTLAGGFSSAPTSYTFNAGTYTKIGRYVYFALDLQASGATADGSALSIGGLPFVNIAAGFGGASYSYQVNFNTIATDIYHITSNGSVISVYDVAGASRAGNAAGININNRVILFGSYQTAS